MTEPRRESARQSLEGGLQHERTSLAWERTAIASMVAGVALARYAAATTHFVVAFAGVAQTVLGGGLLVWAAGRYRSLHDIDASTAEVAETSMTRIVGLTTVVFAAVGLVLSVMLAIND